MKYKIVQRSLLLWRRVGDEVKINGLFYISHRYNSKIINSFLPKKLLKKTPIGSARISISGRNLWWYAPNLIEGINSDPEVLAENADTNLQGIETGTTPTTKRFGVNLNVTF